MADLKLDILVLPTYNKTTLGIADASTYSTDPPVVSSPSIEIDIPTFGTVVLPFLINQFNVYTSVTLGVSEVGDIEDLPDGIYRIKYSVAPAYENFVEKSFMRVDKLQEKFDDAFLNLDMMECDSAIKKQSKDELNSIYFFIQGSIAAANNCAEERANSLYQLAMKKLNLFISSDCGCL